MSFYDKFNGFSEKYGKKTIIVSVLAEFIVIILSIALSILVDGK